MRRRLIIATIVLAFVLGFSTNCSCSPHARSISRTEIALASSDFRVQEAWNQAKKLAGVSPVWDEHPPVVLIRAIVIGPDGRRLLGRYITYIDVDKRNGRVVPVEQILVYLLPHEDAMLEKVITHEFLHALWQRQTVDPKFVRANPDSEVYVCRLLPCDN